MDAFYTKMQAVEAMLDSSTKLCYKLAYSRKVVTVVSSTNHYTVDSLLSHIP